MRKTIKFTAWFFVITSVVLFALAFFSTDMFKQFGKAPEGERLQKIQALPLYDGKALQNPSDFGSDAMGSMWAMMREWVFCKEVRVPQNPIRAEEFDANAFARRTTEGIRFVWIGHSSVLIEVDEFRILTDPVFSKRCSPTSLMGPVRFHDVKIPNDILKTVDVVLISHDHYDHLDYPTIERFVNTQVKFVVPLGIGAHLESWGIESKRIYEREWWEAVSLWDGDLELVCTPARHFSGRGVTRNQTLWASWVIRTPNRSIYFSGDTGYFDGFKEIGEKYGPFEFTMLDMAAYHEEYWPSVHMWPEQAVQAHVDLRGEVMMPVHWGTFNLAYHAWDEPVERLLTAAKAKNVSLVTPRPGQLISLASSPAVNPWWRQAK